MGDHAPDEGIFEGPAVEVLLGDRRKHVLEEFLGVVFVLGGRQNTRSRDEDYSARIALLQMVVTGRERLSLVSEEPVEVVVIDEANIDFAGGYGGNDGCVVRVILDAIR